MRALLRWWPVFLVTSIVVLLLTGRFRAEEQARQKEAKASGNKEVVSMLRTVIKRGALLYNARDHAGCYRFFQGSLTSMRPLLAKKPDLQKAIDASLDEAERNPSISQRGWILYRSLSRVYSNLNPRKESSADKKADKADKKAKDKKRKDSKEKDKKKKKKPKDKKKDGKKGKDKDKKADKSGKDKSGDDKDVPKDLLKDVKKADKPAADIKPEGKKQANAKVVGKVVVNGEPLQGGTITFHPVKEKKVAPKGKKYSGKILQDGTYEVPAIVEGQYIITVTNPNPALKKYADPDKSGLTVQAQKGDNVFDIQLMK